MSGLDLPAGAGADDLRKLDVNLEISRRLLAALDSELTVAEALDAVLGDGTAEKLVVVLNERLRGASPLGLVS